MVWRENLAVLKANKKVPISPKPERLRPPKLVCMRFTSTSNCMNFLSQFYFLTPMDYSPWFEGKFWPFWRQTKKEQNLWNQNSHAHQNWFACVSHQPLIAWIFWANSIFWPPFGAHAFHINLYLHKFFEPILFSDSHGLRQNCFLSVWNSWPLKPAWILYSRV